MAGASSYTSRIAKGALVLEALTGVILGIYRDNGKDNGNYYLESRVEGVA